MIEAHDAWRFWKRSLGRGLLLATSCALVIALAAVNTVVLRSSLWFTPAGVDSSKQYVTLGQHTPEGRFEPVALSDIDRLSAILPQSSYAVYGRADGTIRASGKEWTGQHIALVSDTFYALLGVKAAIGETPSASKRGVLLSFKFWKSNFDSNKEIIGTTINVGGTDMPVLGVAPPAFKSLGDQEPAVWIPSDNVSAFVDLVLPLPDDVVQSAKVQFGREVPFFFGIADQGKISSARLQTWRVRDSKQISLRTNVGPLLLGFDATGHTPAIYKRIDISPDRTRVVARYLTILAVLNASLIFLTLINLASFWSARTSERGQELQTMIAVGAKRANLIRMFASESLPFLLTVAVLAVPLAYLQLSLLRHLGPLGDYLSAKQVTLSAGDFLVGFGVVILVGLIATVFPWQFVRGNLLRSRSLGATRTTQKLRMTITCGQWFLSAIVAGAVAVSLLVGVRLSNASWGGARDPLEITIESNAMGHKDDLVAALGALPQEAEVVGTPPLTRLQLRADAYATSTDRKLVLYFNEASPGVFSALGLPMLAGAPFDEHSENQLVLSQTAASLISNDLSSLVGSKIVKRDPFDSSNDQTFIVVGVVGDVHYNSVESPPEAVAYVPAEPSIAGMTFLLPHRYVDNLPKASTPPAGADGTIAKALIRSQTLSDKLFDQTKTELVLALFTLAFATLALALMCVGLMSMARTQMQQQGRELALRAALGATLAESTWGFIRRQTKLAVMAVTPVLLVYAAAIQFGWIRLPFVHSIDWLYVSGAMVIVLITFELVLFSFIRNQLKNYDLSELLRSER